MISDLVSTKSGTCRDGRAYCGSVLIDQASKSTTFSATTLSSAASSLPAIVIAITKTRVFVPSGIHANQNLVQPGYTDDELKRAPFGDGFDTPEKRRESLYLCDEDNKLEGDMFCPKSCFVSYEDRYDDYCWDPIAVRKEEGLHVSITVDDDVSAQAGTCIDGRKHCGSDLIDSAGKSSSLTSKIALCLAAMVMAITKTRFFVPGETTLLNQTLPSTKVLRTMTSKMRPLEKASRIRKNEDMLCMNA